jgi:hypothetical protein
VTTNSDVTTLPLGELLWISRRRNLTVTLCHLAYDSGTLPLREFLAMPLLSILCPIRNKPFTTSVEAIVQHKAALPNIIKFSYCPYCHTLHGWTPDEAFFEDAYDAFECTAGNT